MKPALMSEVKVSGVIDTEVHLLTLGQISQKGAHSSFSDLAGPTCALDTNLAISEVSGCNLLALF